ncbi:hypothetical protein ACJ73_03274 [Blastomyces percursus]|uniref:Uncharacterized protein n=1 Tax=Blastomyces percursus TaxID=1658174 RepID=A0A1J9QA11_9EURO|nr:hypothetical protein ACJ73_03274 [Blastomyces percursus]
MASPQGYIIIKRENEKSPPEELFGVLARSIGEETLHDLRMSTFSEGARRIPGPNAKELLHYGVNFSDPRLRPSFQDILGCSFDEAIHSEVEVIFWVTNKTQLPRYPAGLRGTIHIFYTATTQELHEDNGIFRIVEGSHTMTRGQSNHIEPIPIRLQPNDILIMSADLTIQYPQAGGVG